jgi:hypothetical protein
LPLPTKTRIQSQNSIASFVASFKCRSTRKFFLMYIKAYHNSANLKFPEGSCRLENALTDADDTFRALRKKVADGIMLWKKDLVDIIQKGVEEGIFDAGVKAEKIAPHIIAISEFGFLIYSVGRRRKQSDEMLEIALEVAQSIVKED